MNRRTLVSMAAIATLAPRIVLGQRPALVYRVAFVGYQSAAMYANPIMAETFRGRLAEQGYIEGKNIEFRAFPAPENAPDDLASIARDAFAWNPDVIRTELTRYTRAMAKLTTSIPIVFTNVNDPVGSGLVKSLAHPGGNLTGVAIMQAELTSMRLELVRDLLPRAKRVALILESTGSPFTDADMKEIYSTARRLRLTVEVFDPASEPRHYVGTLESIAKARPDAVIYVVTTFDGRDRAALGLASGSRSPTTLALLDGFQREHRIPTIYFTTEGVEQGVVASLGASWQEQAQVAADQTAKVLRGTPVGEIPVQQITRILVGINFKTAKELGITVPQSVLIRADKVIQ